MSTQNSSLSHICNFSVSLQLVQKLISEDNSDRMNPADTEAPAGSAQEGGGVSKATHVARMSEGLSLGSALPAAQRGPRRHLTEAAHTRSCRFYFLPMTHFSFCLHLHRLPPCPQQSSPRCFFYFFPNREGFGQILCHTGMSRYLETVRTGEGLAPRTQESRGLGPCPSSPH